MRNKNQSFVKMNVTNILIKIVVLFCLYTIEKSVKKLDKRGE